MILVEYKFICGCSQDRFYFKKNLVEVDKKPKTFVRTDKGGFGPNSNKVLKHDELGTPLVNTWISRSGGSVSMYCEGDTEDNLRIFKQACVRRAQRWMEKAKDDLAKANAYLDAVAITVPDKLSEQE